MNRRSFLSSLGIATASLYLRFAPTSITAIEAASQPAAPVAAIIDDAFRTYGRHVRHKGRVLTHAQMFEINRLKTASERDAYLRDCPSFEDGKLIST